MEKPKIVDVSEASSHWDRKEHLIGLKVRRINGLDFTGEKEVDSKGFLWADIDVYTKKDCYPRDPHLIFFGVKFDYIPKKWKDKLYPEDS